MIELKPCPFCWCAVEVANPHYAPWLTNTGRYFKIVGNHDEECVFNLLGYNYFYESEEDAIEAWNRRVNNEQICD